MPYGGGAVLRDAAKGVLPAIKAVLRDVAKGHVLVVYARRSLCGMLQLAKQRVPVPVPGAEYRQWLLDHLRDPAALEGGDGTDHNSEVQPEQLKFDSDIVTRLDFPTRTQGELHWSSAGCMAWLR